MPERPQTRTESGHLPDLSGAPRAGRVQGRFGVQGRLGLHCQASEQ